jgi:hypothetical protein
MNHQENPLGLHPRYSLERGMFPLPREIARGLRTLILNTVHSESQLVNGVMQFQQTDVRLHSNPQPRRWVAQILKPGNLLLRTIERDDVRPFQSRHFQSQDVISAREFRMFSQPRFKTGTQVAERERSRGTIREVRNSDPVERPRAQHGA